MNRRRFLILHKVLTRLSLLISFYKREVRPFIMRGEVIVNLEMKLGKQEEYRSDEILMNCEIMPFVHESFNIMH